MPAHETAERTLPGNVIAYKPDGLQFGDGTISTKKMLETAEESGLTAEVLEAGKDIILHDARVWCLIEEDDDGCGDGRPTSVIYKLMPVIAGHPESGVHTVVYNKSKRRAKVFGGGLIVASSMLRTAVWGQVTPGDSVLQDRQKTADILKRKAIRFGAHTDNHKHGDKCGCGAIDRFDETFAATIRYRAQITGILKDYLGEAWDTRWDDDLAYVYRSYEDQLESAPTYLADDAGSKTMELIEQSAAVVKELADDHLEAYVVLNDVDGTTFDQRAFEDVLRERGIMANPQVFAVDVWRGRLYADAVAAYGVEEHDMDYDTVYRRSLIDFMARSTSGPAAVLTDGTQPVFLRVA